MRKNRDGEALNFGLLYARYQRRIYWFVVTRIGRRNGADDLTQQVFLRALQNIGAYKDRGLPFSSWLFEIARNLAIDFHRTLKDEVGLYEIEEKNLAIAPIAQILVEKNSEMARVKKALKELGPTHQKVVRMRFHQELSPKEIGALLNKSEGAVKVVQHRAVRRLRQLLA